MDRNSSEEPTLQRNPGSVHVLGNLLEDICSVANEASTFEENTLQDQVGIAMSDRNAKICELEARFHWEDTLRMAMRESVAAKQNERVQLPSGGLGRSHIGPALTKEYLDSVEEKAAKRRFSALSRNTSYTKGRTSVATRGSVMKTRSAPAVAPDPQNVSEQMSRGLKESMESCEVLLHLLDNLSACADRGFQKPSKAVTVQGDRHVTTEGYADMVARLQHQDEALAHARHKLDLARLRSCREIAMSVGTKAARAATDSKQDAAPRGSRLSAGITDAENPDTLNSLKRFHETAGRRSPPHSARSQRSASAISQHSGGTIYSC